MLTCVTDKLFAVATEIFVVKLELQSQLQAFAPGMSQSGVKPFDGGIDHGFSHSKFPLIFFVETRLVVTQEPDFIIECLVEKPLQVLSMFCKQGTVSLLLFTNPFLVQR